MRIELANLEEGRGSFAHVYGPLELDLADDRVGLANGASVEGKIRRSGSKVLVEGSIEAQVQVECDRCLQPLVLPVKPEFALQYMTGEDYEATTTAELTAEEMTVSVFDGEAIDIDEAVREQILLSVPARALCREDCQGICSSCGADLNQGDCSCEPRRIDPRWEALRKLRNGK